MPADPCKLLEDRVPGAAVVTLPPYPTAGYPDVADVLGYGCPEDLLGGFPYGPGRPPNAGGCLDMVSWNEYKEGERGEIRL